MTKLNRILPLTLLAAAFSCGGSASVDEFRANAPTFEKLAIAQNDGDMVEAVADAAPSAAALTNASAGPDCHPHLFVPTREIAGRVHRHFRKHLRHLEELIARNPLAHRQAKT